MCAGASSTAVRPASRAEPVRSTTSPAPTTRVSLAAIEAAGAPTRRLLDATIGPDGRLSSALFLHSAHPFPSYWTYLYDPGNEEPKVDGGRLELKHTRVNAGWWFVSSLDD